MGRGNAQDRRGSAAGRLVVWAAAAAGAVALLLIAMMVMHAVVGSARATPDITDRVAAIVERTRAELGFRDQPDRWPALAAAMDAVMTAGLRLPPDPVFGTNTPYYSRLSDPDDVHDQTTEQQRQAVLDKARAARELLDAEGVFTALWSLREAQRFDGPIAPAPNDGIEHAGACRTTARLLRGDVAMALLAGDDARALRSFEASLTVARALSQQPETIDQFVATSIAMLAYDTARRFAAGDWGGRVDEASARAWIAALDRQPLSAAGAVGAARNSRVFDEMVLAQYYTESGRLLVSAAVRDARWHRQIYDHVAPSSDGTVTKLLSTKAGNAFGDFYEDWDQTLRALDRYETVLERSIGLTRGERARLGLDPAAALDELHRSITVGRVVHDYDLMSGYDFHRAQHDAARLMLAIAAYRARHGAAPESLAQLVPEVLKEIPRDPITGDEWGYKRRTPSPKDPRDYVLYSFWIDLRDDGGRSQSPDGTSARTGDVTGYDYVFNPPEWHER
jgi:hypothetical protein